MMDFPVSGVETYWWLPILVSFGISCFSSIGGVSGAFLLLPFQISVLGFTGPAVSPTNLVFSIVAIPSGVYRYWRERRMVWPLAWMTIVGTLPGVFIGAVIRVRYLPDPTSFKPFAAIVLLYIGGRLAFDFLSGSRAAVPVKSGAFSVQPRLFNLKRIEYEFEGSLYSASSGGILALSFVVGIVGGTYGIGGGAIIAPFFVSVFGLPVYTVAGATLLGTFVTSIAGVGFYVFLDTFYAQAGTAVMPDWLLGGMFGIGGVFGMYVGARLQRFVSARVIKATLATLLLFVAVRYLAPLF